MSRAVYTFAVIAWFLLLIKWGGNLEYADRQAQRNNYCEMVAIYENTKGEMGWPAFKGDCDGN